MANSQGGDYHLYRWRRSSPDTSNHPDRDLVLKLAEGGKQIALDDYGGGEGPSVSTAIIYPAGSRFAYYYETMVFWPNNALNNNFETTGKLADAERTHEVFCALVTNEVKRLYAMLAESQAARE